MESGHCNLCSVPVSRLVFGCCWPAVGGLGGSPGWFWESGRTPGPSVRAFLGPSCLVVCVVKPTRESKQINVIWVVSRCCFVGLLGALLGSIGCSSGGLWGLSWPLAVLAGLSVSSLECLL